MKKNIFKILLIVTLVLSLENYTFAEEGPIIKVQGEGFIFADPDTCKIDISINSKDIDQTIAINNNREKLRQLEELFKKLMLADEDIKTTEISLIDMDTIENNEEQYYLARTSLELTIRDFSRLEEIILALNTSNISSISNVSYSVSNYKDFYKEALKLALKDGLSKGEVIASGLSGKSLSLLKLEELSGNYYNAYYESASPKISLDEKLHLIRPGKIRIEAKLIMEMLYR